MNVLIEVIRVVSLILTLLVLLEILLSYFVDPYHPVRRWVSSLVQPLLSPIRRVVRPIAGFDLSPVVLILLVQIVQQVLVRILLAVG